MLPSHSHLQPESIMNLPANSTNTPSVKALLQQEGVSVSLALLGPGEDLPASDVRPAQDHLLFVIDGSANVKLDALNTLLKKDQALYVAKEKSETIRNQSDGWVKLLRIELPDRESVTAPIYTVADSSVFANDLSGR